VVRRHRPALDDQGQGLVRAALLHYEELPSHMAAKVIEEVNARK
jgi:hypothetical protein